MPLQETSAPDFNVAVPSHAVRRGKRTRAKSSDLGPSPLGLRLLAVQAVLFAVIAALYQHLGLSIAWDTFIPLLPMAVVLSVIWLYYFLVPGKANEWKIPETIFIFLILLFLAKIVAVGQYAAGALNRPYIDPLLAACDASLGVHVPTLAAWTRAHPVINSILYYAYESFVTQLTLAVPVLGFLLSDRRALWEYTYHFHFCAIVTLVCFAVFPAAHAFTYYGFDSTFDMSGMTAHLQAVRTGTLRVIRYDELEGLVSMPSFHMAGAMFVTWSFRRYLFIAAPLAVLNSGLVLATFMSGTHYVVDLLGTVVMMGVSVLLYRKWAEPLLQGATR